MAGDLPRRKQIHSFRRRAPVDGRPRFQIAARLLCASLLLASCGSKNATGKNAAVEAVEIGTWNLKDFPASTDAPGLIAGIISALDLQLVAVQEIVDPAGVDEMLQALPGFSATLYPTTAGATQRVGFLWDASRLTLGAVEALFAAETDVFPRAPLQGEFEDVVTGAHILAIVVHLKAGTTPSDEQHRVEATTELEAKVRETVAAGGNDRILILGDFNEAVSDPRVNEVYGPFATRPDAYDILTWPLAAQGETTFLTTPLYFDHMIATAAITGNVIGGPEVVYEETSVDNYSTRVSDHRPVKMQLSMSW